MPKCVVCGHPEKDEIEAELAIGTPFRVIAEHHPGVSLGALHRHKTNHPSVALVAVHAAISQPGNPADIAHRLEAAVQGCHELVQRAELAGSVSQVVDARREERQAIVALGAWQMEQERMSLLRRPVASVPLLTTGEWIDTRTKMMEWAEAYDLKHGTAVRISLSNFLMGVEDSDPVDPLAQDWIQRGDPNA